MKFQQDMANKQNQDEVFLKWLSPSYWLVEGHLSSVRTQRAEDTLEWARNIPEFETWRRSDASIESKDRILWVRGTLGVGKTIMAGYFIELLKCLHPRAVVAYFFCRVGQDRLRTARDIIRTLAYQCVIDDADARSVLDSLRTKDFRINEETHVGFLVEKLLKEPLNRSKNLVFIVIDGVDEADWTSVDNSQRLPRPEMEAFIKAIGNIPSVHLLFVSRPKPDISTMLPNAVVKSVVKTDNMRDIDAFVKRTVKGSERLKEHFLNEAVDPLEYFHRKANGIFLWVVVVLHQLLQIKGGLEFRKYLHGFSDASGDMEMLYSSVLMNIQNDDQRWIKEILRWLIIGKRELTVNELKAVVEWSVHDNLPKFQTFLEVDCGALLHLVPIHPERFNVQLIHETLRSFLVNVHVCPKEFYVDEKASQGYAMRICLDMLSTNITDDDFTEYAANRWYRHMPTAQCLQEQSSDILASLHRFFGLTGCKRWIERFDEWPNSYDVSFYQEEPALQSVQDTLKAMPEDDTLPSWNDKGRQEEARKWRMEVLETPWKLGHDLGKTAARIWLYADLPCGTIAASFRLALKYYCRKHKIPLYDIAKLQDVAANDFTKISDHYVDRKRNPKKRNLGIGFFVLRLWTDAISKLEVEATTSNDKSLQGYLGFAYLNAGDFEKSKDLLKGSDYRYKYHYCLEMLSLACQTNADIDGAINILKDIRIEPWTVLILAELYASRGDYRSEIELYREMDQAKRTWWFRHLLAKAYLNAGKRNAAERLYQPSVDSDDSMVTDNVADRNVTTGISLGPKESPVYDHN